MIDPSLSSASPLSGASWIWLAGESRSDVYACFRRGFSLPIAAGELLISADTDFVAWLNGVEIGRGQFGDFPQRKTWSRFPIAEGSFSAGENVLTVLVHYRGRESFDHQQGRPGLIAAIHVGERSIVTDHRWEARLHPGYRSGTNEPLTAQTGLTFHFDARNENSDAGWQPAEVVQAEPTGGYWEALAPRPLPPLSLGALPEVRVAFQGRVIGVGEEKSVAKRMTQAALRTELPWFVFSNAALAPSFPSSEVPAGVELPANAYAGAPLNAGALLSPDSSEPLCLRPLEGEGTFLVVDLMRETVGFLELEIDAPAGTILEIAHGEHLDDGRVRARIGPRNFADRYICSEGRQRFSMPFRRLAARYLQVHLFGTGEVRIHTLALRPVSYPTPQVAEFLTADPLAQRLQEAAVRSLDLCRHEHYEDCPWREQALYGYDSRLQALYGYYAFGDYRFPEVSFQLLGESQRSDGFLGLIAPGSHVSTIPSFSLAWVAAVAEHWLYSGSDALFRAVEGRLETLFAAVLSRHDEATGLYRLPEDGDAFWHFYEWTPGLAGEAGAEQWHAAYQLHLHEALRCYRDLLRFSGDDARERQMEDRLASLAAAIHERFYDAKARIYATTLAADGKLSGAHELIQALALHQEVVPPALRTALVERLLQGELTPATLSASYYLIRPLLSDSAASRERLFQRLGGKFESMIFQGATTLWETAAGGDDFDYAGSLCHGWSALPIYLHHAAVLGVTPLEPGFRRFAVRIAPSRFLSAEGTVPTPHGMIRIRWDRGRDGLHLRINAPEECQPLLEPYPETPYLSVEME